MAELEVSTENGVAIATLHRPSQMNALSPELVSLLLEALRDAEANGDVRVLIITGAGRAFCAGADLKFVSDAAQSDDFVGQLMPFLKSLGQLFDAIEGSPLPVIAAVNGLCMAGGLELILSCDVVVASEEATFSDAHATYGLLPAAGATYRLPQKVGLGRAKHMMLTADQISAKTAFAWGLAEHIVPQDELLEAAKSLAERIGEKSPLGVRHMKDMLNGAHQRGRRAALDYELATMETYCQSEDLQEGLAAFISRRKPQFKGG